MCPGEIDPAGLHSSAFCRKFFHSRHQNMRDSVLIMAREARTYVYSLLWARHYRFQIRTLNATTALLLQRESGVRRD